MKTSLILVLLLTLALPVCAYSAQNASNAGIYLPFSFVEEDRFRVLTGHQKQVFSVAVSPDGSTLASGGADKNIILWNAVTGEKLKTLSGHKHVVYSVAFSPDGKVLASGGRDRTIILWDIATGKEIRRLLGHKHTVMSVAFSPDGETLASGSADQKIIIWDVATGKKLRTLEGHSHHVYSVAFSPGGSILASGSRDKTIILWDTATWKKLHTLKGHSHIVQSVVFSPGGSILASGSRDKTIILWDVFTGKQLQTLEGHRSTVHSVSFTPDGQFLASGSRDKTIKVWNTRTGENLRTFTGHKSTVMSVAMSPYGRLMVSGSADRTVVLRDIMGLYIVNFFKKNDTFESTDEYKNRVKGTIFPYSFPVTLTSYNADKECFETQIGGSTVLIPVPKSNAKKLKTDDVIIVGNIRYHDSDTLEMINSYLVDNSSGKKFPFGRHINEDLLGKYIYAFKNIPEQAPVPLQPTMDKPVITPEKDEHASTPVKAAPELYYEVHIEDANGNNMFEGGELIKVTVDVKNRGRGRARTVEILLSGNSTLVSCLGHKRIVGDMGANSERKVTLGCTLPNRLKPETAQLSIELNERRGYAPTEIKSFAVALKPAEVTESKQVISRLIDVDIIPSKNKKFKRENSYAVVIGISNYRDKIIPRVKYAKSDAETVARYLENIGGIPRKNIKILTDEMVTKGDLEAYIEDWLPRRIKKNSEVFIYYAGHGTPDPESGDAYIVPYDGHPDFRSKLYPLKRMYASLNKLPTDQVVVMLDSCFSGAGGRSVTSQGARPISISIENPVLAGGKVLVLAASSGTQISSDYEKVKHGLFTYYLLKGMRGAADKDKNNTIELQELYEYVRENVSETASVELNRDQTPVLLPDVRQAMEKKIKVTRIK